jgi:hypothetical protein
MHVRDVRTAGCMPAAGVPALFFSFSTSTGSAGSMHMPTTAAPPRILLQARAAVDPPQQRGPCRKCRKRRRGPQRAGAARHVSGLAGPGQWMSRREPGSVEESAFLELEDLHGEGEGME